MKKETKRKVGISVFCIIIIAFLVIIFPSIRTWLGVSKKTLISIVISAVESVGVMVSLIIAIRQLGGSKEIARADFLVELNCAFTESLGNIRLYTALQDCLDGKCKHKVEGECCRLEIAKIDVSNYLTFFETIYLLERNGVISFEMIDDLFGYRFFLAVHSKYVQQVKLATQPENFKNIFCLEYEWLQYREKRAHKIDAETSVFKKNPLADLMKTDEQKRIYAGWIKECKKFR